MRRIVSRRMQSRTTERARMLGRSRMGTYRGRVLVMLGAIAAVASLAGARRPVSTEAVRLTIARLQYDGGGDWYANPSSLPNLLNAIRARTSLNVEKTEARVRLWDERLWDFPFLHVTGHGNIKLSEPEVERLRE